MNFFLDKHNKIILKKHTNRLNKDGRKTLQLPTTRELPNQQKMFEKERSLWSWSHINGR